MPLTWDSDYQHQLAFVRDIRQRVELLQDRLMPTTVHSVAEPSAVALQAGWEARKGYAMNIPIYARTQWFDPGSDLIQQEYRKVQDLTGPARSSDTLYGVQPRIPDALITGKVIGSRYIDDAPAAGPILFSNIPQTYNDLLLYLQLRDVTAATTSNIFIRPNNNAGALYGQSYMTGNNAFAAGYGAEGASLTGWVPPGSPGNTSEKLCYAEMLVRIFKYASSDSANKCLIYGCSYWGATIAAATKAQYHLWGSFSNALPITSLAIVSASNFQVGTKAVLWGI